MIHLRRFTRSPAHSAARCMATTSFSLEHWMTQHDIVPRNIDFRFSDGSYTVKANQPVSKGETVLQVPMGMVFYSGALVDGPRNPSLDLTHKVVGGVMEGYEDLANPEQPTRELFHLVKLSLSLWLQQYVRNLGSPNPSPWDGWIAQCPQFVNNGLQVDEQQVLDVLEAIPGRQWSTYDDKLKQRFLKQLRDEKLILEKLVGAIEADLRPLLDLIEGAKQDDAPGASFVEDIVGGASLCASQAINFSTAVYPLDMPAGNTWQNLGYGVIPGVNFVPHGVSSNVSVELPRVTFHAPGNDSIKLVATQDIETGEELAIDYGIASNETAIRKYGIRSEHYPMGPAAKANAAAVPEVGTIRDKFQFV